MLPRDGPTPSPRPEPEHAEEYSETKVSPCTSRRGQTPSPCEKVQAKEDLRSLDQPHGETEAQGRAESSFKPPDVSCPARPSTSSLRKAVLSPFKHLKSSQSS